ncbi:MAG: hypothetical protein WCS17_13025 [Prevotella sp.]
MIPKDEAIKAALWIAAVGRGVDVLVQRNSYRNEAPITRESLLANWPTCVKRIEKEYSGGASPDSNLSIGCHYSISPKGVAEIFKDIPVTVTWSEIKKLLKQHTDPQATLFEYLAEVQSNANTEESF